MPWGDTCVLCRDVLILKFCEESDVKGMDSTSYADTMRMSQGLGRHLGTGKAGMFTLPSLMYSWGPKAASPMSTCAQLGTSLDPGILLTSVLPEKPLSPKQSGLLSTGSSANKSRAFFE